MEVGTRSRGSSRLSAQSTGSGRWSSRGLLRARRATCFDIDDALLAAHGLSLSVRREDGRWIQTVKASED